MAPTSGDPDLFGSLTCATPGPSNNQWSSVTAYQESIIVPSSYCLSPPCTFYFSVNSWDNKNTAYTISVGPAGASSTLYDGIAALGQVAINNYVYYNATLYPQGPSSSFVISLMPFSGAPDVYVTLNDNSGNWPSRTNNQYFSLGLGGVQLITLNANDPRFASLCPANAPCNVAISVFGWSASDYMIAWYTVGHATPLINGVPVQGAVAANQMGYYSFQITQSVPLVRMLLSGPL